jgi:drug/metabolite transporter (DMT)-like permease
VVLLGWSDLPLEPRTFIAVGASLFAALSYAVAGTLVKRRLAGVEPSAIVLGQAGMGSLILLPFAAASVPPTMPSPAALGAVILLGVVATVVAFLLFYRVLASVGPTAASTATMLAPVVGVAWGVLLFGEPVGVGTIIGVALVLVALSLVLNLPVGAAVRRVLGRAPRPTLETPAVGAATPLGRAA